MIITRATEYAIRSVLFLAQQPQGEIVLKKDICATQNVTPAFLTKILQPLIRAGLVGSQRGVGGGFFLMKSPKEITLLDVVQAQEGSLFFNHCLAGEGVCDRDATCPVHNAWREAQQQLVQTLGNHSFAKLLKHGEAKIA